MIVGQGFLTQLAALSGGHEDARAVGVRAALEAAVRAFADGAGMVEGAVGGSTRAVIIPVDAEGPMRVVSTRAVAVGPRVFGDADTRRWRGCAEPARAWRHIAFAVLLGLVGGALGRQVIGVAGLLDLGS